MDKPFIDVVPNTDQQVEITYARTKSSYLCGHAYQSEGWARSCVMQFRRAYELLIKTVRDKTQCKATAKERLVYKKIY